MKFELGPGLRCNLQKLVDSRLLVQANSGGGKSHTLRRLLEQTHGHVQQLVIDPEGEFASLREKYDYVYAAKQGGDTAADPRSAKLLAERLLELGVSAILDIYELKAHDRIRFVRLFLEALIDAKKTLWHPALVVVDEAHVFCPQQGEAESAGAVIDLATRGRKRGFCALLATQRLSKLHKDAAAELNNKLIGRTGLDVDRKRAAEELGFTTREESLQLRSLDPGEFFAFGPALSAEVKRVTVGPVQTTHPKAGARLATIAPPPTEKVKALLPKLADLPAEAEERTRTLQDLQRENADLKRRTVQLERAGTVQTAAKATTDTAALRDELRQAGTDRDRLARQAHDLTHALERLMKFILEINAQDFFTAGGEAVDQAAIQKAIDGAAQQLLKLVEQDLRGRRTAFEKWRRQGEQLLEQMSKLVKQDVKLTVAVKHNAPFTLSSQPPARVARVRPDPPVDGAFVVGNVEQKILDQLAELAAIGVDPADKVQLGFFCGYTNTRSGGFSEPVGRLVKAGLIASPRASVLALTEAGRAQARPSDLPATTEALQQRILEQLDGPRSKILAALLTLYPKQISKEDLGAQLG